MLLRVSCLDQSEKIELNGNVMMLMDRSDLLLREQYILVCLSTM